MPIYGPTGTPIYTNVAARDAAIPSPVEGQTAFTQDYEVEWTYVVTINGGSWVPAIGTPIVAMNRVGPQSIVTGSTPSAVSWDTAAYNRFGAWSSSIASRLSAPFNGWFEAVANVSFIANATGFRTLAIYKAGTPLPSAYVIEPTSNGTYAATLHVRPVLFWLNAAEYVVVMVSQTSNSGLDLTAGLGQYTTGVTLTYRGAQNSNGL